MNPTTITQRIYSILRNDGSQVKEGNVPVVQKKIPRRIPEDILQMVWVHALDGMRITDSDGIVVAVNKPFCSLVEMEEAELIGVPFTVIYDSSVDRKAIYDEYQRKILDPHYYAKYEKELHLASGKRIQCEISVSTLVDDADERYVLTELRDISERKKWEASLFENEKKYRSIFENSILPLYQSSVDGKLINANSALLQLLGYETFEELHSLDLEKDVYVDSSQRSDLFENAVKMESIPPTELELKRKDGSHIFVLAHTRVMSNEQGEITGFEGALENITEQKKLELQIKAYISRLESAQDELTKLNSQKDKILAIVSHDLRSPFTSILGFCEILKTEFSSLSDDEKKEYISYISDAAHQQLEMVNALLDWSRIETGRITLNIRPSDIGKLAMDTMKTLLGIAKQKGVDLVSSIPPQVEVNVDEQLIRQLLSNLIGNALKFTPAGGRISIALKEHTPEATLITVSDSGIGIPKEHIHKLFKIEEKYTRQGIAGENGTGLGLPMCYEIMQKHHGSITVESVEGLGTTFTLIFHHRQNLAFRKVLIVDDQKGNRLLVSRYLQKLYPQMDMEFAESGKEALSLLSIHQFDIIFTDFHMPEMDGMQFIGAIRNDITHSKTPVILLSGEHLNTKDTDDIYTRILLKPLKMSDLQNTLHTFHT